MIIIPKSLFMRKLHVHLNVMRLLVVASVTLLISHNANAQLYMDSNGKTSLGDYSSSNDGTLNVTYAFGQDQTSTDYPFIYGVDEIYSYHYSDVYPIQLYPILDEITLRKVPEIQVDELENIVMSYLPDAIFDWKPYQDNVDVCMVKAGSDISDEVMDDLFKEDAISFLYRNYIRKIYKDLMDIYPVKEVSDYGFWGMIEFRYLKKDKEVFEKVDSLIKSKGLEILTSDTLNTLAGYVTISKNLDIIAVANEMYESGYFSYACPMYNSYKTKILNTLPIDKSTLPFFNYNNGNKQYLYELYDRFMVRKSSTISRSALESVIKRQLEESEIIWENESICTVLTIQEQVESTMEAIIQEDGVSRVSHEYFYVDEYETCLKRGEKNPEAFGLTGVIKISFKDNINEADKAKIISDYNLQLVREDTVQKYWHYEVRKDFDVLDVCNSIFDTGLVVYSTPATSLSVAPHPNNTGSTTIVKGTLYNNKAIGTQYYNLSGQRINTPTGLTIVVTRYSNGTIRTEKRLYGD